MAILKKNRSVNPDQISCKAGNGTSSAARNRIAGLSSEIFPRINVYEESDHWFVTFEVPGVEPNDIELVVRNNIMTVRGQRASFHESDDSRIHSKESCIGECDFSRSLHLPENADLDGIHARLAYGVLQVKMEKAESSAEEKRIDILS